MRARPPLWAARAATSCCGVVSRTRNVSPATPNVTPATDDGDVGLLSPPAVASSVARASQAVNLRSGLSRTGQLLRQLIPHCSFEMAPPTTLQRRPAEGPRAST